VGQEYGFGSRTRALAGAGAAWGFGAFAAYYNPGALPFQGEKRLLLEGGLVDMTPNFTSINNVIVENAYVSDKVTYGSVANDYRSTSGEELGFVYRLFPDFHNITFGVTSYLPLQQLAYIDTGETFVPEYVLYRARTQRPQVELGGGFDLTPRWHLGAGLHVAYSLTSSATVFLQTDPTKPSTMRFSASMSPKVAPDVGLLYTSEPEPGEAPRLTAGLVMRFAVASDNTLVLQSAARAFGSFAALDFDFNAISTIFYDPFSVELGGTFAETPSTRTYAQLEFQAWSHFKAPALLIQNPSSNNTCNNGPCGVIISPGQLPAFPYQDIFIPRIGQEYTFGRLTLRAGYAWQPGIFADGGNGPSGAGNYLDPSKHIFTLGAGYHFLHFLNFDVPCDVDVNLAYQALVTEHVTKTPGDENGQGTGDLKIGAPGYDAGGSVYGGGLSLTMAF
jgi:hypothetical protein